MGFCSGTDIFDPVAENVLDSDLSVERQAEIIRVLIVALYDHDWDCESDSRYYDHPLVRRILRELNPED